MALTKTTYSMIAGAAYSVLDYGADPTGVTDSTTAIQNTVNAAVLTGGTVFLPKGFYRVTSTINIGLQIYTNYSQATTMVPWDSCTTNATNKAANLSKKRIDFVGEAETYIIGDFVPGSITPIIAYNLDNNTTEVTGTVSNLIIVSKNQFVNGVFTPAPFDSNQLIGLFVGRGSKVVEKILFYGCGYGLVALGPYWCSHRDMEATYCGTAFTFNGHNAAFASNLNAVLCVTGYRYTGQNGRLSTFGTENCDNDAIIESADCCVIGPAYLEDTRVSGGAGKFCMKLGTTADSYQITGSEFTGILTLIQVASGKKGWRFWGCARTTLNSCRFYGAPYEIEALTDGYANGDSGPTEFYRNGVLTKTYEPFMGDSFGVAFTYVQRKGYSSAVADLVTANIRISWSSIGAVDGSPLIIQLPYTAKNVANQTFSATIGYAQGVPLTTQLVGLVEPNTNYIRLYSLSNTGAGTLVAANACNATGDISLSITYPAVVVTK